MAKTKIPVAGVGYIGLAHTVVAQKSPTCTMSAIVEAARSGRIVDTAAA